jgi:hypothetical protein
MGGIMTAGTPIDRHWFGVLSNGIVILEWGDGTGVDMASNEFIQLKQGQWVQAAQDADLEMLRRMGRITGYDNLKVYVLSLPERPSSK